MTRLTSVANDVAVGYFLDSSFVATSVKHNGFGIRSEESGTEVVGFGVNALYANLKFVDSRVSNL